MPAFAQDFARRRDVLGGKPLEAELAGLEVHRHEQREIIQERRDRRREHDLGIRDAEEFGHDEAHRAHDGRCELSPGGGDCLDGGGEFGLVPGLFHERDGDRPGSGDVGEGAAVDHAHERAGHHGNLGGAASRAPYEGEREIIDKIAESAVFQEGSEEHEQENVGGGHADAHAEEPLAAPEHVLDDAVPGKPGMPERAGNPFPGEVVEEKHARQRRKVADHAPGHFEADDHADGGHEVVDGQEIAAAQGDFRIIEDEIAEREQPRSNTQGIEQGGAGTAAAFALPCRIHEEGEHQQENDVPRAQGHGVEGRKGGRVHLEQREDHRQRGDGRCPRAFTVMPEA